MITNPNDFNITSSRIFQTISHYRVNTLLFAPIMNEEGMASDDVVFYYTLTERALQWLYAIYLASQDSLYPWLNPRVSFDAGLGELQFIWEHVEPYSRPIKERLIVSIGTETSHYQLTHFNEKETILLTEESVTTTDAVASAWLLFQEI